MKTPKIKIEIYEGDGEWIAWFSWRIGSEKGVAERVKYSEPTKVNASEWFETSRGTAAGAARFIQSVLSDLPATAENSRHD